MDNNELLVVNDPENVSEEYNRLYAIYETIFDKDHSAVDDMTAILTITNNASIAMYRAWDVFNIRNRQRSTSNSYAISNYFNDDREKTARNLLIKSLNEYIRRLESFRYGENKIKTLYAFMMSSGLYEIIAEIYIPDYLKPIVDGIINSISTRLDELIVECQQYFALKNNEKLNQIIISLGRIILSQRSDQVFQTLSKYDDTLDEDDLEFLMEKRSEYLDYSNDPKLTSAKSAFSLSEGSYYRNLGQIINDLNVILDEDTWTLLEDLFLRG